MQLRSFFSCLSLLCLAGFVLASCSPKEATFYSRSGENPPPSTLSLQELIDKTPDGGTVSVPKAKFVLKQGLLVANRKNIRIECAPGSQILVDDISADVIEIVDSKGISISGAFLRHLNPLKKYECHGDVVKLRNASEVTIENSELDGCGAIGLSAWGSSNITVQNCLIAHNSFNALYIDGCATVRIKDNVIENNANLIQSYRSDDIEMSGNVIRNNGGYWDTPGKAGLKK